MTAQVTKEKGLLRMQMTYFCSLFILHCTRSMIWKICRLTTVTTHAPFVLLLLSGGTMSPNSMSCWVFLFEWTCLSVLLQTTFAIYPTKIILDSLFIILRKREKQLSFLHVYHHATMWVKISICDDHSHHVYFAQVPPLVDWGQICGGRLQFSGETLNLTSLVWCHPDMFLFSGCLLQLLCPCDHVLLLRSLNSWGTCQVVSYHQLILSRTILVHGRGGGITAKDWYRNV